MAECYLVIGLGNPGKVYEDTRHNIGFRIAKTLGAKYGATFKPDLARVKGSLGKICIEEKEIRILMPMTYMNESGLSVGMCRRFYKMPTSHLIVVTDDASLPFGKIRLREQGSSGGHNGLKSVEAHLGTQEYSRLKVGIGDNEEQDLSDHVLGRFTQKQQQQLPKVVNEAVEAIELWISKGIKMAMQKVNRS